jgi:lipoprotein-anchoring transpeptidase ErfK/SrfK
MRVSGRGAPRVIGRLWRIAALAAAGAIGSASHADAALYYWSDTGYSHYSQPGPAFPQRRQKARPRQAKKLEIPGKESAKPQGPLIIAISIERQSLKVYDANGFFAETPISTGMKGHPTPMGVFSIIQKHKLHHSNIYSGAPMPFMQRITWSGVAMHAGVLPGYPASHGCIRMPLAFATKMWGWTKMGARVVVTPGEISPSSFSHPLLATQKVVPQPVAAAEPKPDVVAASKTDKAAADVANKPATSEASLELRSTIAEGVRTQTADASSVATNTPVTMTDAGSRGGDASSREAVSIKADDASSADALSETAKSEAESVAAERSATAAADKAVEAKPSEAATAEMKSAEIDATDKPGSKPDQPEIAPTIKADAPKASENPDDSVTAATPANAPDLKKDQTRLPVIDKPVLAKPEPPKRSGQIAVLVSRKDGKLYVRQNFAPLFDVPVTIAPSDRPLGTHVFTAQVDKNDANVLRWSVVSLPVPARYAERRDEDERASRRRKMTGAVETKPVPVPNSPAEALDRLTIPADAMARIVEALSTGGSIVVSDQGVASGETGEGTDFIVSLR